MKIKNKKKWFLRDKGIHRHDKDREHYNRAYVKKLTEEVTFLPFSRSSKFDDWGDGYSHKWAEYPFRWLEKQVGKDANEVYQRFVGLGWHNATCCDEYWNSYAGVDTEYRERYIHRRRTYYVDGNGIIRRYSDLADKEDDNLYLTKDQWIWNRDNPLPDYLFDETQKGMKKLSKKYWVEYNGKILFLSIYLFPTQPDKCTFEYFYFHKEKLYKRKMDDFSKHFEAVNVRVNGGYLKNAYVSVAEAGLEWVCSIHN